MGRRIAAFAGRGHALGVLAEQLLLAVDLNVLRGVGGTIPGVVRTHEQPPVSTGKPVRLLSEPSAEPFAEGLLRHGLQGLPAEFPEKPF
jgi:hypothetical protein